MWTSSALTTDYLTTRPCTHLPTYSPTIALNIQQPQPERKFPGRRCTSSTASSEPAPPAAYDTVQAVSWPCLIRFAQRPTSRLTSAAPSERSLSPLTSLKSSRSDSCFPCTHARTQSPPPWDVVTIKQQNETGSQIGILSRCRLAYQVNRSEPRNKSISDALSSLKLSSLELYMV